MERHSERINQRVDELEPEQRDYVKQAIREIAVKCIARRDASDSIDLERRQAA